MLVRPYTDVKTEIKNGKLSPFGTQGSTGEIIREIEYRHLCGLGKWHGLRAARVFPGYEVRPMILAHSHLLQVRLATLVEAASRLVSVA